MKKYRVQYWHGHKTALAIQFAHHRVGYISGDFYVRAIKSSTDLTKNPFKKELYTSAFTLDQARLYIQNSSTKVGEVHDCFGLRLEDDQKYIDFDQPIIIRNMGSSIISAPTNIIDASAIRRQTWYEDTELILSTIWGEEKAKRKIGEWRLPQELVEQDTLEYKIKR